MALMVLLCILFLCIRRNAALLKVIMYVYTHTFLIALIQKCFLLLPYVKFSSGTLLLVRTGAEIALL